MAELIITRGLPASGKTTFAKAWVAEDIDTRARVNRDDLRLLLHGKATYFPEQEKVVTLASHSSVESLLRAGKSVVVDDTNLRVKYVKQFMEIAKKAGATYRVVDFEVDIEECIRRDHLREKSVGDAVILSMYDRYFRKGKLPPAPVLNDEEIFGAPYAPNDSLQQAIIVDLDGTVALHNRSPYDYDRLDTDSPNWNVIEAVKDLQEAGKKIVFLSGRPDSHKDLTVSWLDRYFWDYDGPFMRRTGDERKDFIIKQELFDGYIRNSYNVVGVFDDRNQVVRMWRKLGLTVFQVADGDF